MHPDRVITIIRPGASMGNGKHKHGQPLAAPLFVSYYKPASPSRVSDTWPLPTSAWICGCACVHTTTSVGIQRLQPPTQQQVAPADEVCTFDATKIVWRSQLCSQRAMHEGTLRFFPLHGDVDKVIVIVIVFQNLVHLAYPPLDESMPMLVSRHSLQSALEGGWASVLAHQKIILQYLLRPNRMVGSSTRFSFVDSSPYNHIYRLVTKICPSTSTGRQFVEQRLSEGHRGSRDSLCCYLNMLVEYRLYFTKLFYTRLHKGLPVQLCVEKQSIVYCGVVESLLHSTLQLLLPSTHFTTVLQYTRLSSSRKMSIPYYTILHVLHFHSLLDCMYYTATILYYTILCYTKRCSIVQ